MNNYREGNITASFGADLFLNGTTSLPNLLLKFYTQLGISDTEMMLIIQILRIRNEKNDKFPSYEKLAACLDQDADKIEKLISNLIKNEFISVKEYFDESSLSIAKFYDFELLFEKISEIWACRKLDELKRIESIIEKRQVFQQKVVSQDLKDLTATFEREFNRPLSPIEFDQINRWLEEGNSTELIIEALRRAVLLGKHNFKYIDSIILEWKKNNLVNVKQIQDYEQDFKKRQTVHSNKVKNFSKGNEKSQEYDKKKEFIKSLYLS